MGWSEMHASEENRHSLQAQLVPECCSMRNLDWNQPAAGSSSISEKTRARKMHSPQSGRYDHVTKKFYLCAKLICMVVYHHIRQVVALDFFQKVWFS